MPGLFPQLSSLLTKQKNPNEAQQQNPGMFQQMPQAQPMPAQQSPMQGLFGRLTQPGGLQQPQQPAPQQPQPGPPISGTQRQGLFNQAQQRMNAGLAGGRFNRRRY